MQSEQIANKENQRLILDKSLVQKLINSMDTEWDKKIARVTFGAYHSRSEIDKLGISSHDIKKLTDHVMDVIQARDDIKVLYFYVHDLQNHLTTVLLTFYCSFFDTPELSLFCPSSFKNFRIINH